MASRVEVKLETVLASSAEDGAIDTLADLAQLEESTASFHAPLDTAYHFVLENHHVTL